MCGGKGRRGGSFYASRDVIPFYGVCVCVCDFQHTRRYISQTKALYYIMCYWMAKFWLIRFRIYLPRCLSVFLILNGPSRVRRKRWVVPGKGERFLDAVPNERQRFHWNAARVEGVSRKVFLGLIWWRDRWAESSCDGQDRGVGCGISTLIHRTTRLGRSRNMYRKREEGIGYNISFVIELV